MKIGGLLLALLVILLGTIPCCSFEECEEEAVGEHSPQEIPGSCEDSCSPFLNCNGCTGFTVQDTPEKNNSVFKAPSDKISSHQQQWISGGIVKLIWQPPQVS